MAPERVDRGRLRADLRALIAECAPDLDGDLADHSPLITSGVIESTALLQMALWVEEQIGGKVDITAFDLVAQWDSIAAILDFVERHASAAVGPGARAR